MNSFNITPFDVLLVCLILVLTVYCIIPFAGFYVTIVHGQWLRQILNPSNFVEGSFWQSRAIAVLRWFDSLIDQEPVSMRTVQSPTRVYHTNDNYAAGDLCDVRYASSGERPYVVKATRLPGGEALLAKERMILEDLQCQSRGSVYGEYFPVPVESFWDGHRLYTTFERRAGLSPASEVLRHYPGGVDGRHLAWMFNRALEALGFAHQQGWIHGAVLPQHLMLDAEDHALQLIGWTHAEEIGRPLRVVPRRFKAWYPPECHRREAATPATDIYLAAKSVVWLAGGNPLADSAPGHLPQEIGRLLVECLAESPWRRPQDAWTLHERFQQLLGDVYGPPLFCHFTMS